MLKLSDFFNASCTMYKFMTDHSVPLESVLRGLLIIRFISRCGASHCSGNIGLSYTQQPTDAARSVKPTSVATNKKKKSQTADEKEQLLFTTVYVSN